MTNACGSCTACCKLMAVTEVQKPKNIMCQHCDPGVGCKIYDDRPSSCRTFRCIWLQTQSSVTPLPLSMRPDKSRVVVITTPDGKDIIARTDPHHPFAWMKKDMGHFLGKLSEGLMVLVDNGKQYWVIQNRGIREVKMSKPDANGVEHFEGYALS